MKKYLLLLLLAITAGCAAFGDLSADKTAYRGPFKIMHFLEKTIGNYTDRAHTKIRNEGSQYCLAKITWTSTGEINIRKFNPNEGRIWYKNEALYIDYKCSNSRSVFNESI